MDLSKFNVGDRVKISNRLETTKRGIITEVFEDILGAWIIINVTGRDYFLKACFEEVIMIKKYVPPKS